MKCGECANADFEKTPTGRIKANLSGRCLKVPELVKHYTHAGAAPCIVVAKPHVVCVWPDYDATHCPMFVSAKAHDQ